MTFDQLPVAKVELSNAVTAERKPDIGRERNKKTKALRSQGSVEVPVEQKHFHHMWV